VDIAVPIVKDETSDARYNSAREEQTQVTPSATAIMGVEDLTPLSLAPAGTRIQYGDDPLQFGELSLPAGRVGSDHPVVINVHGGCWLSEYPIDHSRALARALAGSGFAVWNIEYRRVGDSGGGWPGTFEDVAAAADFIRKLAEPYRLDLARVVLMGHSAGGQLALWLACRKRIPRRSVLAARDPLPVRGVVALAPATELVELYEQQVYDGVIGKLLGGSPREVPERFDAVVPSRLAPSGIPQHVITGRHDSEWGWHGPAYVRAIENLETAPVRLVEIEDAGHYELIAPSSNAWRQVEKSVSGMLNLSRATN